VANRFHQPPPLLHILFESLRRQVAGHWRFRHTVEDANIGADERQSPLKNRHGKAGAANIDRLQSLEPRIACIQMVEPAHELGWHQRCPRRPGSHDTRRKLLGIETASQDHCRTGEQMRHKNDLGDRPERTDIQKDGVAADIEALHRVLRDGQQISVAQHRGFRCAGRAAAEIECREIVALAVGQWLLRRLLQQRLVA
jgi:hypothetical protein